MAKTNHDWAGMAAERRLVNEAVAAAKRAIRGAAGHDGDERQATVTVNGREIWVHLRLEKRKWHHITVDPWDERLKNVDRHFSTPLQKAVQRRLNFLGASEDSEVVSSPRLG